MKEEVSDFSSAGWNDEEVMHWLTPDEVQVYREVLAWKNRSPGFFSSAWKKVARLIDAAAGLIPDFIRDGIEGLIEMWIGFLTDVSQVTISQRSVFNAINQRLRDENRVRTFDDILDQDIRILDNVASSYINYAVARDCAEAIPAGFGGWLTMLADVNYVLASNIRLVQSISMTYGIDISKPGSDRYVLYILNYGHSLNEESIRRALESDWKMALGAIKSGKTWEEIGKTLIGRALKEVFRKLGWKLTKRKAAQLIQGFAIAVGVAINRKLAKDVGESSYHLNRQMFLVRTAFSRMKRSESTN